MNARVFLSTIFLVLIALGAGSCGTAKKNCLVIPAQIELVGERREAAMRELENRATQVDRLRASLERSQRQYDELLSEQALLDSLMSHASED
jgi:hypothetical protein